AFPIDRRRHPELRCRAFVKAAARSVARIDHRGGHAGSPFQAALHSVEPPRLHILARAQPDNAFEVSLEVVRARPEPGGESFQRWGRIRIVEIRACPADGHRPGFCRHVLRIAYPHDAALSVSCGTPNPEP